MLSGKQGTEVTVTDAPSSSGTILCVGRLQELEGDIEIIQSSPTFAKIDEELKAQRG